MLGSRLGQAGIAKLHPPAYCVIPYQAFEAAGFEQDLPRNEIKAESMFFRPLTLQEWPKRVHIGVLDGNKPFY